MSPGQHRENQRLLASILGVAEDEAADLLLQVVQITWTPDDPAGALLGPYVVQLLRRTFHGVGTPDAPHSHAGCELVINAAPSRCAMARQVRAHLDAEGLRVDQANLREALDHGIRTCCKQSANS